MKDKTRQGPNADLTHEIILNVGGKASLAVRCTERDAERTAKAIGMPWPSDSSVLWPLRIRKIGARADIEANALAQALAPKLAIPDGQVSVFMTGVDLQPKMDGAFEWLPAGKALESLRELIDRNPEKVWSIVVAEPGTLITR